MIFRLSSMCAGITFGYASVTGILLAGDSLGLPAALTGLGMGFALTIAFLCIEAYRGELA